MSSASATELLAKVTSGSHHKAMALTKSLFTMLLGSHAEVLVGEMDPAHAPPLSDLPMEEAKLAENAVLSRQQEFSAGRTLARELLQRLKFQAPVLRDEDRSPVWPEGVVGSITHTRGYCAVAVAEASRVLGVGLDVESSSPLKSEAILDAIASPEDHDWLATKRDPLRWGKLIFSAKECAYKAQYPLAKKYLGFDAMWIEPLGIGPGSSADPPTRGEFIAHFRVASGGFSPGDQVRGRFAFDEALPLVGTSVILPK